MHRRSMIRIGATALALLSGPSAAFCEPVTNPAKTAAVQTFGPFLTAIMGRSFYVDRPDGRSTAQSASRIAPNAVLFLGFKITMTGENTAYATSDQDPDQVYWPVKFTENSMTISSVDQKMASIYYIDAKGDLNWTSVNAYFADARANGVYPWAGVQRAGLSGQRR